MMLPVVVTSVNPTRRQAHQLRCLQAWQDVGFDIFTANSPRSWKMLEQDGLDTAHHLPIPARETYLDDAGSPTPVIPFLLERFAHTFPDRALLLVGSDLFPTMRGPDCIHLWQGIAPALALVAEKAPLLETYRYSDKSPSHDHVDAFLIQSEMIVPLIQALRKWPISEQMCLGDSGWGLLLTAVILSEEIKGQVIDSAILLREPAPQRASHPGPGFTPYIPALRALDMAEAGDPLGVIEDFGTTIAEACLPHSRLSATIKALHFAAPELEEPTSDTALEIAKNLLPIVPWVHWNYDVGVLSILADRISDDAPIGFAQIAAALCCSPNQSHQFSEGLFAVLMYLTGRPETALKEVTAPDIALKQILNKALIATETNSAARRLALVQIFGHQITDHNIFILPLHDAIALSCQNEFDRILLDAITSHTGKVANAA